MTSLIHVLHYTAAAFLIAGVCLAACARSALPAMIERKKLGTSLINWRHQLLADRKAGGNAFRLAHDYRAIARILIQLGKRQDAIDEYRHAILIMETTFAGHPCMAEFYSGYLRILRRSQDAAEIARIKAKRAALPKY